MAQSHLDLALTTPDREALARHEAVIARGLLTFYEVGAALLAIRDAHLYRDEYGTFEEYCSVRWGLKERRAYHLMAAAEAVANLESCTIVQLPRNEAQARPLGRLATPEQQRDAWNLAQDLAAEHTTDGKVTATWVEIAVAHIKDPTKVMIPRNGEEPPAPDLTPPEAQPAPTAAPLAVHFSSDTPEWYTPPHVVAAVLDFFDAIDLDPCSNSHETPTIPAARHYTVDDDGLASAWFGRVYVNPPYGRDIGRWVARAAYAYESRECEACILLVPARPDTAWFRRLRDYAVCFVAGRLSFVGPNGTEDPAPFPSALVYLGDEYARFAEAFAPLGDVWTRWGIGR